MVMRRISPASELASLRDLMDRFLEQGFVQPRVRAGAAVMPIDLYEKDDAFILKSYLPGVKADDVEVSVNQNTITVKSHISADAEKEEAKNYRWMVNELGWGDVARSVTLPAPFQADKIDAVVDNGVLILTVPKAEEAKPKQIKVKAR